MPNEKRPLKEVSAVDSQTQPNGSTIADGVERLFHKVWCHKLLFTGILTLVLLVSASVSYLIPERFVARASILPGSQSGGLSSIMSSLGQLPMISNLGVGAGGTQLYPSIAKSGYVVDRLLKAQFEGESVETFLLKDQKVDSLAHYSLASDLKGAISTNINLRNNIFSVQFGHRNKYFAAFVVNTVVENMEEYLSSSQKDDLGEQMLTIRTRLREVSATMEDSEVRLLEFYKHNKIIEGSAELRMTERTLLRQQSIETELYLELVRQREFLNIKMAGTAPVLTVLDRANVPMIRSSPNRIKIVGVSLVLAFVFLLIFLEFFGGKLSWLKKSTKG